MSVNHIHRTGISGLGRTQELTSTPGSGRARTSTSSRTDQTAISNLSQALSATQPDSSAHTARLQQLTGAVSSGRYTVDSNAVSGSIIEQSLRA